MRFYCASTASTDYTLFRSVVFSSPADIVLKANRRTLQMLKGTIIAFHYSAFSASADTARKEGMCK